MASSRESGGMLASSGGLDVWGIHGRLHLSTEDIDAIAPAVLRHRIILNIDAHEEGQTPETILSRIIPSVGAAVH